MKKLFAILAFAAITMNATAQNLYVIGFYRENGIKVAAVYRNGERLYTSINHSITAMPKVIVCDSEENVYWMVNRVNYTEIYKNDQLFVSTENAQDVHIVDMYCLHDTLYYTGYQTNEESINVATVWRGSDTTPHWVIGDGIHDSRIYDADVDKWTGIPYFCGYQTDEKQKGCVWKKTDLLFTCQDLNYYYDTVAIITSSAMQEISVDDGCVHTFGWLDDSFGWDGLNAHWVNNHLGVLGYDYYGGICYSNGRLYSINASGASPTTATGVNIGPYTNAGFVHFREGRNDIYLVGMIDDTGMIWKNGERFLQINDCIEIEDVFPSEYYPEMQSEWYYEIENSNGSITYQHLECVGDTLFNREGKRPKVIVRSNTHYDRNEITEVTHEYVYEENGIVYWWNKDLQEFTTLYNLNANVGDEWEIKVGAEYVSMHVDSLEYYEYEGRAFRIMHVSDENNLFSGNIVCGVGHLTSFFPERLMTRGKGYSVEGLRCYWVDEELIFKFGEEDCDAIYKELHNGFDEPTYNTVFEMYPNPTNGVLYVEMVFTPSLLDQTYRITNLMGQTLLQGTLHNETQQINIDILPAGMYFISVGEQTVKFVKQ